MAVGLGFNVKYSKCMLLGLNSYSRKKVNFWPLFGFWMAVTAAFIALKYSRFPGILKNKL
jgi:hypothetical protein